MNHPFASPLERRLLLVLTFALSCVLALWPRGARA